MGGSASVEDRSEQGLQRMRGRMGVSRMEAKGEPQQQELEAFTRI